MTGPPAAVVAKGGNHAATLAAAVVPMLAGVGTRAGQHPGPAVVLTRLCQPTPVAATVVHELVDLLLERGCARVVVAGALTTGDRDRGHRSVESLAREAGLTGRTPRGRDYELVDAHADLSQAPVPAASVLSGQPVSAAWAGAGLRVVLARSVTDLFDGYAGCLATLQGAAPEVAGATPADVAADLLAHLPPDLAVVDATCTSHGQDGARVLRPLQTDTVIAATDGLLADCALATLLGEDRSSSRPVQRCLSRRTTGLPPVSGDTKPFVGIRRVHPMLRDAARRCQEQPGLVRLLAAATGGPDRGAAPADPVLSAIRSMLTPMVEAADHSAGRAALLGLLETAAALGAALPRSWTATLAKDRVGRVEVPLGFDPLSPGDDAYDGLPAFFAEFDRILDALPPVGDGMRWCLVDGATVFEVSREVPADFDAFVARVDVAEGISLMADYLGGRRVVMSTGADGAVRQAERNVYLPQPNYLALWGARPIDVCKIELVERRPDEHRLTWRTVESPNGTAPHDDGTLVFARAGEGRTRLVIRGRQLFALPPTWAAVDLAAVPEIRTPLLEEAYRRFFTATFDNLEAAFEGREFRIGRPPAVGDDLLVTSTLHQLLGLAQGWLGRPDLLSTNAFGARRDRAYELDLHGFRHFRRPP